MNELIRNLRLSKLIEAPLTIDLKRLSDAINFIQETLDKIELKKYPTTNDEYPNTEFYFINDKLYFEYNSKVGTMWCRYTDFWEVLEEKFVYNYEDIRCLVKVMMEEHFKKEIRPTSSSDLNFIGLENHFKSQTESFN